MKDRVLVGWSGGKDSAMALYEIKRNENAEVAALLTAVTEGYNRISMHGVPRELLIAQADSLGYPLHEIFIPQTCTNQIYEQRMQTALEKYRQEGISTAVFGDLFLEEIRAYREERMRRIGMRCLFPV
jgi:diphthamide synthase (EF-2-diphthine--ammonia ligase)